MARLEWPRTDSEARERARAREGAARHGLGHPLTGARVLERRRLARRHAHEAVLRVPPAAVTVRLPERRRQVQQPPQPPEQLQVRRELGGPGDLHHGRGEGGDGGWERVPSVLVRAVFLGGVAPENGVVHLHRQVHCCQQFMCARP